MTEPEVDIDSLRFAAEQPEVYEIPALLRGAANRIERLERELGEPRVVACRSLQDFDKGPWKVIDGGRQVTSDDFTHDATLRVSGDFENGDARFAYATALAQTLNGEPSGVLRP
jgi:hypothetical protein